MYNLLLFVVSWSFLKTFLVLPLLKYPRFFELDCEFIKVRSCV